MWENQRNGPSVSNTKKVSRVFFYLFFNDSFLINANRFIHMSHITLDIPEKICILNMPQYSF